MVLILCVAILALAIVAVNVRTVVYGYYDSFVRRGVDVDTAASHLQALAQPVGDAQLEELQAEWDSWRYSRLRESVTTEAQDGTELHGYLYDEGSDVTAIYLPRFHGTGLDDFLMGPWLNAETGCNILMLDPRAHGESRRTWRAGLTGRMRPWESRPSCCAGRGAAPTRFCLPPPSGTWTAGWLTLWQRAPTPHSGQKPAISCGPVSGSRPSHS